MYFLLTSYTLIMFLKVLSHFIMKVKNFIKYFKEGVLKYFKISVIFLNISKWNISSCIPRSKVTTVCAIWRWFSGWFSWLTYHGHILFSVCMHDLPLPWLPSVQVWIFLQGVSVAASPVLATIGMSVCPSVRHTLTLCENDAS